MLKEKISAGKLGIWLLLFVFSCACMMLLLPQKVLAKTVVKTINAGYQP